MDLSTLTVPEDLREAVKGADRNRDLLQQPVSVNPAGGRNGYQPLDSPRDRA